MSPAIADAEAKMTEASEVMASLDLDDQDAYPRLPVELIVVTSEFLIGDFAFGTAANLNLASHAVREEKMAVLYETLCVDGYRPAVRDYLRREELNPGLKYTKFLVFDDPMTLDEEKHPPKLPNLIMGIQVHVHHYDSRLSRLNTERDVQYLTTSHLWLYQSLSASVAFLMLKTPVWVWRPRHSDANISNSVNTPTARPGGVEKYSRTCDYPVFILDGLHLAPGGALTDRQHVALESVTFDLCLYSTAIYGLEHSSPSPGKDVETALALLTLGGMQTHHKSCQDIGPESGCHKVTPLHANVVSCSPIT